MDYGEHCAGFSLTEESHIYVPKKQFLVLDVTYVDNRLSGWIAGAPQSGRLFTLDGNGPGHERFYIQLSDDGEAYFKLRGYNEPRVTQTHFNPWKFIWVFSTINGNGVTTWSETFQVRCNDGGSDGGYGSGQEKMYWRALIHRVAATAKAKSSKDHRWPTIKRIERAPFKTKSPKSAVARSGPKRKRVEAAK